jgi:hypothetical protein
MCPDHKERYIDRYAGYLIWKADFDEVFERCRAGGTIDTLECFNRALEPLQSWYWEEWSYADKERVRDALLLLRDECPRVPPEEMETIDNLVANIKSTL